MATPSNRRRRFPPTRDALRQAAAEAARAAAFFPLLGLYLRRPVNLEEARATLRQRLERREADFLDLARRAIYAHPGSPYRRLLRHAGCEYGDLVRLVRQESLEGALSLLQRRGIYITSPELKGKRPIERGSLRFTLDPGQLRTPLWLVPHPIRTRSWRRLLVPQYLAMFADVAVNGVLCLAARGGTRWQHALWHLPEIGPILWQLRYSGPGYRPARFFSRLDLDAGAGVERWHRAARLVRVASTAAGSGLPYPEHVPLAAPEPIIAWMSDTLRTGQTPNLMTTVSPAVSLCGVASEAGLDLQGVQLSVSGEPLTPRRLAALQRTGATPLPSFGTKESGLIAHGCLAPAQSDDLHLYHDVNAVITPGPAGAAPDLPADALLLSSLRQSWPILLLNVSLGDRADLDARACGCPLERLGWTTHLHTVRSFEKMKVGGLAVPDAYFIRLLEEVLPARFGGGPTDYQLVQEEAAIDGTAHLRLLIHPKVGPVDENALAHTFLEGARHAGVQVEQLWATVRWITVERQPPLLTAGGKLYHVHRRDWPLGQ